MAATTKKDAASVISQPPPENKFDGVPGLMAIVESRLDDLSMADKARFEYLRERADSAAQSE